MSEQPRITSSRRRPADERITISTFDTAAGKVAINGYGMTPIFLGACLMEDRNAAGGQMPGWLGRIGVIVLWVGLASSTASAGPPFRTDDPEPVEYQHYELYTFFTGTRVRGETSGVGPGLEVNYGLIPNGQLHIVAPLSFDSPFDRPNQYGYGDTELGFKYRFIQEGETRPQVGVFPFLELPTGDQSRGLGAGHSRVYLPLWLQKSFGDWTTYGGGGYWINHGAGSNDKDYWFFGWLLQKKVTDRLVIGGELFHQTATTIDGKNSTGFNIGAIYDIDEHNHLLLSAGRGFQHASENNLFSWYVAYLITN
jgi:hypothetical protein